MEHLKQGGLRPGQVAKENKENTGEEIWAIKITK